MSVRVEYMEFTDRTPVRCSRCGLRDLYGRSAKQGWNTVLASGIITGFLCPSCQTPEENAEAEVNQAMLNYRVDSFGRIRAEAKR